MKISTVRRFSYGLLKTVVSVSISGMTQKLSLGQVVRDVRQPLPKGVAIIVGDGKLPKQVWICPWRGKVLHWGRPIAVDRKQLKATSMVDWATLPLTEAKRISSAAYERNYLSRALSLAEGSVVDAARIAGVDRSNFRRLLDRHGLS